MTRTRFLTSVVARHGWQEGVADYLGRAVDVLNGREAREWAWPLNDADTAYVNAVGVKAIVRSWRLPEACWEEYSEVWFQAFRAGYRAARAADQAPDWDSDNRTCAPQGRKPPY